MRTFLLFGFLSLIALPDNLAWGQLNRKVIKRNNKKISTYRGPRSAFGKEKRYKTMGLSINAINYYGDIAPRPQRISTDISFTRPGVGLSLTNRFGPRYTLKAEFLYGTLRGDDAKSADQNDLTNGVYRYARNLSFRNRIKELSVVAIFDLFENQSTYISRVSWTPYAFSGLTLFHHNPQAMVPATDLNGNPLPNAGQWVALRPLGTEGQYSHLLESDKNYGIKPYSLIQISIPFGMGARIRINEVTDLWMELAFRYTFTDYLDDVSQNYIDLGVLGDNELAKTMSYRTNELEFPDNSYAYIGRDGNTYQVRPGYGSEHPANRRGSKEERDIYMVTTIRLTYIIGATLHRAKFR